MGPDPARSHDVDETYWRSAGGRIQHLLEASAADGPVAQGRAEKLVREVVDLYGAVLARIVDGVGDPAVVDRLVADDLVASLLLVHGLHPHDVTRRVAHALDTVRPYLGSHGGDVRLLDVTDGAEGSTVRLEFSGNCKGCPSSAVTLELTVEDAVRAAAPEVTSIQVVTVEPETDGAVIPVESLLEQVRAGGHRPTSWHPVPDLAELRDGEVGGFAVGDANVLACRVGDQVLAYLDHCPACSGSLAGAQLTGQILRCPRCHARYDVLHAGAGVADTAPRLQPVPVLPRGGVLSMAVPAQPMGASA